PERSNRDNSSSRVLPCPLVSGFVSITAAPGASRCTPAGKLHELLESAFHRLEVRAKARESCIAKPFLHDSKRLSVARSQFRAARRGGLREQIVGDHVIGVRISRGELLQLSGRALRIKQVAFKNRPLLRVANVRARE